MKPIILTLLILSLCGLVSSQARAFQKCRDLPAEVDKRDGPLAMVRADLAQGPWKIVGADELQHLLRFRPDGTAEWHALEAAGQHYSTTRYRWRVDLLRAEPVLTLTPEAEGEPFRYFVEQTCDGLVLTDLETGHKVAYSFVKPDTSRHKARLRQLAGLWVNTHPNLELEVPCEEEKVLSIEHAEVRYTFHPDGGFHKVLTSRKDPDLAYEEKGRWEVTPDGHHLLLYRNTEDGRSLTTVAAIKYLELDEMVLTHPVASHGRHQVADADADLFFNRH